MEAGDFVAGALAAAALLAALPLLSAADEPLPEVAFSPESERPSKNSTQASSTLDGSSW